MSKPASSLCHFPSILPRTCEAVRQFEKGLIQDTDVVIPNGCEESYCFSGFLKAKISPGVYPELSEGVEMTGRKSQWPASDRNK